MQATLAGRDSPSYWLGFTWGHAQRAWVMDGTDEIIHGYFPMDAWIHPDAIQGRACRRLRRPPSHAVVAAVNEKTRDFRSTAINASHITWQSDENNLNMVSLVTDYNGL